MSLVSLSGGPGTVCWVDLGTPDPEATMAFYGRLFGWTFDETEDPTYRVALLDGLPVAGIGPASDPGAPYWTVYVEVADLDEVADATDVTEGTVGRSAVLHDPAGWRVSLWEPGTHPGFGITGVPGALTSVQMNAEWPSQVLATLGWKHDRSEGLFRRGAEPVAVAGAPAGALSWLVSFGVADLRAAQLLSQSLGATSGGDGTLSDPCGAVFALEPIEEERHPF